MKKIEATQREMNCFPENQPDWNALQEKVEKLRHRYLCIQGSLDNNMREQKEVLEKLKLTNVPEDYQDVIGS